jgi:glycosyltransferase involved in cell wall biosynthesis
VAADAPFLTVIVPVLDEGKTIAPFLDALDMSITQVATTVDTVFVDGGSDDDTVQTIQSRGFSVVHGDQGRGNQIAEGMQRTTGTWVLILHADALIAPDTLKDLVGHLNGSPALTWGILGHGYDDRTVGLLLTSWFNSLRFKVLGLAYGDQGIFFNRELLISLGGFPEQPLMEDVELSLMLRSYRRTRLGRYLTVSARQWRSKGFWKYTFGNLRLARRYLKERRSGRLPADLADEAYREYYGHPPKRKSR